MPGELYRHSLPPYTRVLLAAVPPTFEKQRQRIHYEPSIDHIQCDEARAMHEILPEHFVYANTPELERYRLML